MRLVDTYSHKNGHVEWEQRGQMESLRKIFDAPRLQVTSGNTTTIRNHFRQHITMQGWSAEVRIAPEYDVTIFSALGDLALQVQTGNVARAFYDLLKLEYLYSARRIEAGALLLPTSAGATALGSNIANYERVTNELKLFDRVVNLPLLVLAFE